MPLLLLVVEQQKLDACGRGTTIDATKPAIVSTNGGWVRRVWRCRTARPGNQRDGDSHHRPASRRTSIICPA